MSTLDDYLEINWSRICEEIKEQLPTFFDESGGFNETGYYFEVRQEKRAELPGMMEFLFWNELKNNFYWRSFGRLKNHQEYFGKLLGDVDLEKIAEIMFKQVLGAINELIS